MAVLRPGRALGACLALAALASAAPAPHAPPPAPPPDPAVERRAEMQTLDLEIARYDALLARTADKEQRAVSKSFLDNFKDRREALRKKFDHDLYDELRWEIDVEYQRLAAWVGGSEKRSS